MIRTFSRSIGRVAIAIALVSGLVTGPEAVAGLVLPDTSSNPGMYLTINVPGGDYTHIDARGGNFGGTLNGQALAATYCIDVTRDIQPPGTYSTTVTNDATIFGTPVANAGAIAWLILNLAPTATVGDEQNGLQAAIWRTEYGAGFQLDGADNSTAGNSASLIAQYQTDLALLGSNTAPVGELAWISPVDVNNVDSQGLVGLYASGPLSVPEPSSIWLSALGGCGALTLSRRRRRAA
jgi:hypothetical protein